VITSPWDGKSLTCIDEYGAEFQFEPSPEDQPRAVIWSKGDEVRFKKLDLRCSFNWRGSRTSTGKADSAVFRMKTDED
jgi:hypothetical protein